MVQLRTQRTALTLYGVLLVLPTLVLGGLQWHQLMTDYDAEREAVPHKADDAAARLRGVVNDSLNQVLEREGRRPFTEYGTMMISSDASLASATPVTSPLASGTRPTGILAWFAFDLRVDRAIDLWAGGRAETAELQKEYYAPLKELMASYFDELQSGILLSSRWDQPELVDVSLLPVVFNRLHQRDPDCLQEGLSELSRRRVTLQVTPFHVQFFKDSADVPRLVATRRVLTAQLSELKTFSKCFDPLSQGLGLVQGFFIDPNWFFRTLPAEAAKNVIDKSQQRFVPWEGPPCCGEDSQEYHAYINLIADLEIETNKPNEQFFATMRVAADMQAMDANFASLRWRFLGLAAMLAVSLGTGMWLMLRSVRKDLEQATRTENFVAAVTHELRTPLTSIKMYGELLLDGDAPQPEKQRDYYRRIVRATERLGTLVERVLEKSRLTAGGARPEPGDLNDLVRGLERQLSQYGHEGDLAFLLDPTLPDVLLTQEAVTSILSNLVENARKYAPIDPSQPGAEPILVRTRVDNGEVALEVLDRGPGVPEGEHEKIFEAFYRVGTEATRTARGAGLGLHLVLLQARSIGGDAGYRPREGGGSVFWVHFAPAAEA